jgi:hypothetical protein
MKKMLVAFLIALVASADAQTVRSQAPNPTVFTSVKTFGAAGNGVTDDTSAIQLAINITGAAGGGTVFLPAGTYKFTPPLTIGYGGVTLQGTGYGSRLTFAGSGVSPAISNPDTVQRTAIWIRDLRLSSTVSGQGLGIDASYWAIGGTQDIWIDGVNAGILHGSVYGDYNHDINPRISISGAGAYAIKFDAQANENTVTRARIITDATATGIIVNAHSISLYDPDVETTALVGIDVQSSGHSCTIVAPYLEGNKTNLRVASGVRQLTLLGGTISDGSTANIEDQGAIGFTRVGTQVQYAVEPLTVSRGPVSADGFMVDMATTTTPSVLRDSHAFLWRGTYADSGGTPHTVDWRILNNVTSDTGGSKLRMMSRTDSNSYAEKLSVDGSGVLTTGGRIVAGGPVQVPFAAKASAYPIVANTDSIISADATSAPVTITLPTAVNIQGRTFTIKRINSGANAVTVATTSAQTIDGAATRSLGSQWSSVTVVSDGANWLVIASL